MMNNNHGSFNCEHYCTVSIVSIVSTAVDEIPFCLISLGLPG